MSTLSIAFITSLSLNFHDYLSNVEVLDVQTPFGSVPVRTGDIAPGRRVASITRSSPEQPSMPQEINYRANLMALQQLKIKYIFATSAVGSLHTTMNIGDLVLVDQFIDLTSHRPPTVFDNTNFRFVDFTEPYCPTLRQLVIDMAIKKGVHMATHGCYAGVDGPRFRTSAEARMLAILGGDVAGHTNIPECIFARELGICYVTLCVVSNHGAGLLPQQKHITLNKINATMQERGITALQLLVDAARNLDLEYICECSIPVLSGVDTLKAPRGNQEMRRD